ncbi:hypothetical protein PanWU01x14_067950 [Parasponia andersonii]|uniref:Transmembrane protein n=1 Tax=Parasponia andersonii TaxID=3476 RepID=A0A2P5DFA3_PARAD|nr:hypothetical protein PanWU01x14_067950 [Parasponia andersonii]
MEEHNVAFHLLLADLIVYIVAILMVVQEAPAPNIITLFRYIFLICGTTAIELILFILVTHLGWFLAISGFGFLFYKYGYWVLSKLNDLFQQALIRFRQFLATFSSAAVGAESEEAHEARDGDEMSELV